MFQSTIPAREATKKEEKTNFETEAEQAERLEREASEGADLGVYMHKLKKPFTYEGRTVETLTFDWQSLTGKDYNAIEDGMLRNGKNLIVPEYSGPFLAGMAVRACTDRDEDGRRALPDTKALEALPLREYKAILGRARTFLIWSE